MNDKSLNQLEVLTNEVKGLAINFNCLSQEVREIKNNHLPTIDKKVEEAMTFAKQAAFRSEVNTWIFIAGTIFLALMIGLLALK